MFRDYLAYDNMTYPCPNCGETAWTKYTCKECDTTRCASCDTPIRKCFRCGKWVCSDCHIIFDYGVFFCEECYRSDHYNAEGVPCPECGGGSVLVMFTLCTGYWRCIECFNQYWAPWPEDKPDDEEGYEEDDDYEEDEWEEDDDDEDEDGYEDDAED
ncbi:hypothetical protein BVY01_05295 [bacterium I07]|nr:hypothetical protein BVY01_05295 [bacterium I07]